MKMVMKPLLLIMLAVMFAWGCGDAETEDYGASQGAIKGKDLRCLAVPTCPAGSEEVDVCPENASCEPVSLCGQTILCAEQRVNCMAMPTCPAGSEQVDVCPDGALCKPVSMCGQTILCAEAMMNCMAVPTCPAGSKQVDVCPPNASCEPVSLCGQTIQCLKRM